MASSRSTSRPRRAAGGLLAALLLLAAACGDGEVTASGDPSAAYDHPTGADDVVLDVTEEGGFTLVGAALTRLPSLRATGDGRAFTLGPQIAIYPPPALPNVVVAPVDLQELLREADEAGLLDDPPDYGTPPLADVPTTVVTITAEGRTVVHEAPSLMAGEADVPGLTPDQQAARDRLAGFLAVARDLASSGGDEAYESSAFAVWAAPATDAGGPGDEEAADGADDDGPVDDIAPTVVAWPLPDIDLAGAAGCVVVDGPAADTLREALAAANQLTRFAQADVVYEVWTRPLLPGDDGCPPGSMTAVSTA